MEGFYGALVGVAPALLLTVAALATVYCLRRRKHRGLELTPWQSGSVVCVAVSATLFASWWFGLREPPPQLPDPGDSRFFNFAWEIAPPSGFVPDETGSKWLGVGDHFPAFGARGWLNGPGLPPSESKAGLTVVDVWNELCPVCHEAAPGLVELREKWEGRGVNFVGFTARDREHAEAFVERHNIAWPNGYGIDDLHDSSPQVFIVDREGWIVWYDQRLRYRHEPERLIRELDEAIDHALATIGS